jgi:hypothetical protein
LPSRIKLAKQRHVIARLILDLMKLPVETHMGTNHYASRCDDMILMCAITIGQIEGRLMTAAKLSDYAGLPRPTVVRKLKQFEKAGMVEMKDGAPVGIIDHLNMEGLAPMINAMIQAIHRASAELSKMDSKGIAADSVPK